MPDQAEEWLPIPGYEGLYEASNMGQIRSLERTVVDVQAKKERARTFKGRVLKQHCNPRTKTLSVVLSTNSDCKRVSVSRLVCLAFYGPPPEGKNNALCYDYKLTNRNQASNLYWGSLKSDETVAIKNRSQRGNPKLNEAQIRVLRKLNLRTLPGLRKQLAEIWGVSANTLSTVSKSHWKNLSTESIWDKAESLSNVV